MRTILGRFPARVALVALILYLLTLSRGVTVNSLSLTAKVAGWDWQPMVGHPVLWLVTLPWRLLPNGWLAVGLNIFSAFCGAVTLGILARSLELLPWNARMENLAGWKRQLAGWLAAAVCGLQFSFWQEATGATGEMLDALILAAALWCMLEYRWGREMRWLYAAALIWGLGMAENWVMLLTLPLFVGGLIWLRKERFFRLDFLLPVTGLGLAGFSAYALLPLANGLLPGSPWDLGTAWAASFKETKYLLLELRGEFWLAHRLITLTVLLFYLLPVMACVVRLRDEGTHNRSGPDQFQIWIFRALRTALLLFCIWLAFDPVVGLRQILADQANLSLPLLSFDYLNALGVGYLAGNLLLMQGQDTPDDRRYSGTSLARWFESLAAPAVTVLLLLAMVGLVLRNGTAILLPNRLPLTQYCDLALKGLPPGGGIMLADMPDKLSAFQAAVAREGHHSGWLALNINALPSVQYRMYLEGLHPGLWLADINHRDLTPAEMVYLLNQLTRTSRVFYLHPSFGYFFESFYLEPCGTVYELKSFATNSVDPPALTPETVTRTEKLWDDFTPGLETLKNASVPVSSPANRWLNKTLRLDENVSRQTGLLKQWYSMALDGWGVELQRNGHLPAAQRRFTQAVNLNTNNWVAWMNLFCNTNLQAGTKMNLAGVGTLANRVGNQKNLGLNLSLYGPVDEPACCYLLGTVYTRDGLPRQALQQLDRSHSLAPDVLAPQLALANLYSQYRLNDRAMQTISQIRAQVTNLTANPVLDVEVSLLEANVWLSQTNLTNFRRTLASAMDRHPQDTRLMNRVIQAYLAVNDYADAGQVISNVLILAPNDIDSLLAQSSILIKTQRAGAALPVLNHVLSVTNSPEAKFNRALAYLQTSNYPAAKADYLDLQSLAANSLIVNFGLGEIAAREHETNQAIGYYTLCLSNVPVGSAQWNTIHDRINSLSPNASR